jgi:hypothetical protein
LEVNLTPGVSEEAGKAVGGFIDSMKSQPLALALVVMNICLLAFVFYSNARYSEGRKFAFEQIINQQKEMAQLLSRCIVPGTGMKLQSDESRPVQLPPLPPPKPVDP